MRAGKEDQNWCPLEELIKRHVWRTRIRTSILRGGKRMAENILEVKHLKKYFKTARGTLHAVDDVSLTIEKGKTLGIVGESGCGKSTTGRAILRLLEPTDGQVIFNGQDITALSSSKMRQMRRDMQIIFQDPFSSLDPKKTVSQTIAEPIIENKILKDKKAIDSRVRELMATVCLLYTSVRTQPDRHLLRRCISGTGAFNEGAAGTDLHHRHTCGRRRGRKGKAPGQWCV